MATDPRHRVGRTARKEKVPGTRWARWFLALFAGKNAAVGNGRVLEVQSCSYQFRLRGEHAKSSIPLLASGWQVRYAEVCR